MRELGAVIVIANRGGMRNKKTTWHLFHKISILSIMVLFPVIRCERIGRKRHQSLIRFYTAYDNFTLISTSDITSVEWMGQYFNPSTKGTITGFTLDFYSANAAVYYPLPVEAEMEKSRLQLLTGGLACVSRDRDPCPAAHPERFLFFG